MITLIGIVTFGNLPFTKLTVGEIARNEWALLAAGELNLFVIVGKPGDHETAHWLEEQGIAYLLHHVNKGFPASLNDIFDYAWGSKIKSKNGEGGYDNVILCGNDVVPYPGAIEALIDCAATTDWEWICSSQCDARTLVNLYPQTREFFAGDALVFTDFRARPWDAHAPVVAATAAGIEAHQFKDVQNLCLYKRSVFEQLGYFDANFWPNGYFSDNDFARRAVNAGLKGCGLPHSQYFHFWSRTIHQGEARENDKYFQRNGRFYMMKWGSGFGQETNKLPFGGSPLMLCPQRFGCKAVTLPGSLKIPDRQDEAGIIEYWSKL